MLLLGKQKEKQRMAVQQKPSVGIDVGSFSTKVVRCNPTSRQRYSCVEIPTEVEPIATELGAPKRNVKQGAVTTRRHTDSCLNLSRWSQKQLSGLALKLKETIGDLTRGERLNLSFSVAMCDLRSVQITAGEKPDRTEIGKQLVELTGDNRRRSISIVESQNQTGHVKALSIPEDLVDGLAIELDKLELTPRFAEASPWTTRRLFSTSDPVVCLDLGYSEPTLIAASAEGIQYVRRMKNGGFYRLVQNARESYGLNPQQANRLYNEAVNNDTSSTVDSNLLADCRIDFIENSRIASQRLASEIESAMEFVSWKFSGFSKDKLYIQGGVAENSDFVRRLDSEVKTELTIVEGCEIGIPARFAKAACLAGWRYSDE